MSRHQDHENFRFMGILLYQNGTCLVSEDTSKSIASVLLGEEFFCPYFDSVRVAKPKIKGGWVIDLSLTTASHGCVKALTALLRSEKGKILVLEEAGSGPSASS